MKLVGRQELAAVPDLRHRLQQSRWFRSTFRRNARALAAHYGITFEIDNDRLDRAFHDWAEALAPKKRFVRIDRADFIVFAAGLALKQLIRHAPARAVLSPQARQEGGLPEIVAFWPEGFLYTNYCVTAIAALFQQEFGREPQFSACMDDLRTWWSFRENSQEFPAYAVAFLDRFLGGDPNWTMPDIPESRRAMQNAAAGSPRPPVAGPA